MGKWADLAARLKKRDQEQLEDMNSYYGGGPAIDNLIALALGRATDALTALMQVLAYMDEQDKEKLNVKLTDCANSEGEAEK